ncbi:hypothetical protein EKK58_02430 [Candidatus Dependentiae bacterium]|nr:MAG: hypothetical protein EKK58_02430 [Candidatus Dependentiae bacterium]
MIDKKSFVHTILIKIILFCGNGFLYALPDKHDSMPIGNEFLPNLDSEQFNSLTERMNGNQKMQDLESDTNDLYLEKKLHTTDEKFISSGTNELHSDNLSNSINTKRDINVEIIYNNIKDNMDRELDQYACESDAIISQGKENADKIPAEMVHAKRIIKNAAGHLVKGVKEVKVFLETPEARNFFNKALNELNSLFVHVGGLLAHAGTHALYALKEKIDQHGPAYKYNEHKKKQKQVIEFIEFKKNKDFDLGDIAVKERNPGLLATDTYVTGRLMQKVGVGLLCVGLPYLLYRYSHTLKTFALKIRGYFLKKVINSEE